MPGTLYQSKKDRNYCFLADEGYGRYAAEMELRSHLGTCAHQQLRFLLGKLLFRPGGGRLRAGSFRHAGAIAHEIYTGCGLMSWNIRRIIEASTEFCKES